MTPNTLTIGGRRYRFSWANCGPKVDGQCDPPDGRGKGIRIRPGLKHCPRQLLETLLHELTHAADWSKDEEWIDDYATDVARILWSFGYRREE